MIKIETQKLKIPRQELDFDTSRLWHFGYENITQLQDRIDFLITTATMLDYEIEYRMIPSDEEFLFFAKSFEFRRVRYGLLFIKTLDKSRVIGIDLFQYAIESARVRKASSLSGENPIEKLIEKIIEDKGNSFYI